MSTTSSVRKSSAAGRRLPANAIDLADVFAITADEAPLIGSIADELLAFDPVSDVDQFILEAQALSARLPRRIREALLRFRRYGSASGGLLVRGLPVGSVPPTPKTADHSIGASLHAARCMALLVAVLGDQFGFRAELGGQVFQNISPVQGFETTQQSISSLAALLMHGETVFTDNRADYVVLTCIRADHDGVAGTTLSSGRKILTKLSADDVALLRQRIFATTVDGSFLRGGGINHPVLVGPIAVLTGSDERPRFRCDFAETRPLRPSDKAASNVLQRLWDAVLESAIELRLTAGDMLIIDNHEAFHGRTPFVPRFDGMDRWLLRSFLTKDLSRSVSDRPRDGRVVDRDYARGDGILDWEAES